VEARLNPIVSSLPEGLHAAEITVPYSQSYLNRREHEWTPLYRLYYETNHWVTQVVEGPDGEPWYRIKDEMLMNDSLDYYVPANHVRLIPDDEMTPLSPEVPLGQKSVEVSLEKQELTAFENSRVVLKTKISSGLNYHPEGEISWLTPSGTFNVQTKMFPSTWVVDNFRPILKHTSFPACPGSPSLTSKWCRIPRHILHHNLACK
jgi:hypothetical protein